MLLFYPAEHSHGWHLIHLLLHELRKVALVHCGPVVPRHGAQRCLVRLHLLFSLDQGQQLLTELLELHAGHAVL